MIMCISLYHSLILLNKNLTPASLGSPCMHTHLDENPGQEEDLGAAPMVRLHHPWLLLPPIFFHISLILW